MRHLKKCTLVELFYVRTRWSPHSAIKISTRRRLNMQTVVSPLFIQECEVSRPWVLRNATKLLFSVCTHDMQANRTGFYPIYVLKVNEELIYWKRKNIFILKIIYKIYCNFNIIFFYHNSLSMNSFDISCILSTSARPDLSRNNT